MLDAESALTILPPPSPQGDPPCSWQPVTAELPTIAGSQDTALAYSTGAQAFFVVRRDCGTDVANAIQRVGY